MVDKFVLETNVKTCGFNSHYPYNMKIIKEKKIRATYVDRDVEKVAGKMLKTVTGLGTPGIKKSYRNICKVTGRSRGVISGKGRMV